MGIGELFLHFICSVKKYKKLINLTALLNSLDSRTGTLAKMHCGFYKSFGLHKAFFRENKIQNDMNDEGSRPELVVLVVLNNNGLCQPKPRSTKNNV